MVEFVGEFGVDLSRCQRQTPVRLLLGQWSAKVRFVRRGRDFREIGPGQTLLVRHTRRPHRLYPKLDALGCAHQTAELTGGHVEIRITRPAASQT